MRPNRDSDRDSDRRAGRVLSHLLTNPVDPIEALAKVPRVLRDFGLRGRGGQQVLYVAPVCDRLAETIRRAADEAGVSIGDLGVTEVAWREQRIGLPWVIHVLEVRAERRRREDAGRWQGYRAKNRNAASRRGADISRRARALDRVLAARARQIRREHPYTLDHSQHWLARELSRALGRSKHTIRRRLTTLGIR